MFRVVSYLNEQLLPPLENIRGRTIPVPLKHIFGRTTPIFTYKHFRWTTLNAEKLFIKIMRRSLARLLSSTYVSLTLTKFCCVCFLVSHLNGVKLFPIFHTLQCLLLSLLHLCCYLFCLLKCTCILIHNFYFFHI